MSWPLCNAALVVLKDSAAALNSAGFVDQGRPRKVKGRRMDGRRDGWKQDFRSQRKQSGPTGRVFFLLTVGSVLAQQAPTGPVVLSWWALAEENANCFLVCTAEDLLETKGSAAAVPSLRHGMAWPGSIWLEHRT